MVANCLKCRKIFNKIKSPICPECQKKEEELFDAVRLFIKENPNTSMEEVIEETGVTKKKIIKWIKEKKLDLVLTGENAIRCSKCGVVISSGNICEKCSKSFIDTVNSLQSKVVVEKEKRLSHAMETAKRRRK